MLFLGCSFHMRIRMKKSCLHEKFPGEIAEENAAPSWRALTLLPNVVLKICELYAMLKTQHLSRHACCK